MYNLPKYTVRLLSTESGNGDENYKCHFYLQRLLDTRSDLCPVRV